MSENLTDIEILEKLKGIVTPYVQNKKGLEEFDEHTDLINDLKINSAHLVDVILDVEDEFTIEIDNEAMNEMLTAGDAKKIIRRKILKI